MRWCARCPPVFQERTWATTHDEEHRQPSTTAASIPIRRCSALRRRCSACRWPPTAPSPRNLFWVLAYDTEYAMVDRDDDIHLGIQTSAITLGRWDVAMVIGFYLLHLLGWTWALALWREPFWGITMLLALAQVAWHHAHIKGRTREGCFKAFRVNHWLGFTVFVGVVLTRGSG